MGHNQPKNYSKYHLVSLMDEKQRYTFDIFVAFLTPVDTLTNSALGKCKIHSLGPISGAHPRVENINNASAIDIGKMKTFAGRKMPTHLLYQSDKFKYTVFTLYYKPLSENLLFNIQFDF